MPDKTILKVDWASHVATRYACENWHYSGSVPVPPLVKIGVWEDKKFIGVVIFARGASSNLLKPYGLNQDQGCELVRVALREHKSAVTRIIRLAIVFLKKKSPGLKLIVSFADPHQGHHGGIYQGGNWIYVGDTDRGKEYWHRGKKLHSRQVSEKGWNIQQGKIRKTIKPSQCNVVDTPGKHRYLMPLDKTIASRLRLLAQPYPKRQKKHDSEHPSESGRGSTDPGAPISSKEASNT